MLGTAIAIVAQAFEGKTDKGGKPYFLHCMRVMNSVAHLGEDYMCTAILHDLVEDTDFTISDLVNHRFNQNVIYAVTLLTHDPKTDYNKYIQMLANDDIARAVKLADLRDNSDITRLKGLTKKDFDRLEKYSRAYVYLSKI